MMAGRVYSICCRWCWNRPASCGACLKLRGEWIARHGDVVVSVLDLRETERRVMELMR